MSTLEVNNIKDTGSNSLISSNGSGTFTINNGVLKNTPAFQATLSADQSLSDNVSAKIQFDTEDFDTDGCYDNTTNYRFTPTTAGKYLAYSTARLDTVTQSDNTYSQLFLQKNGSTISTSMVDFRANNGRQVALIVQYIVDMNGTTDYLEVSGLINDSNSTGGHIESANGSTIFGAYKLIGA